MYTLSVLPGWAGLAGSDTAGNCSILPDFAQLMVQHKAEVLPIFLAYRHISIEGVCIPLIQVASAIVQVLWDDTALDAVQPMWNGWCIYLRTIAHRTKLVNSGLTLVG